MTGLHFTDEGEGDTLVFIHGYCESHTLWSDFTAPFRKEYRVICIDLPGFGKSPLLPLPFTIADVAKSVWDFLDSISIDTCFLVGHSLGGYVSLEMANQQPGRLVGFCLFHSTAYPDDENKKLNRTKVMEFVANNGTIPFVETLLPTLFAQPNTRLPHLVEEASKIDPQTIISYAQAMRDRHDMTKVYSEFRSPILFFIGMKDTVFSPQSIEEQASVVKDKVVCKLEEAAHMGMIEASSLTQSTLLRFLKDLF